MSDSKGSGSGCLKFLGFGCLGIFILITIASSLFSGGGPASGLVIVAIVVTIVVIAVRSNKKQSQGIKAEAWDTDSPSTRSARTVTDSPLPAPADSAKATSAFAANSLGSAKGVLANPLCDHTFGRASTIAQNYVVCACGNTFASADLLAYDRLTGILIDTEQKLTALEAKMSAAASVPAPTTSLNSSPAATSASKAWDTQPVRPPRIDNPSQPDVEFVPAPRVAATKPKAPKVERPKVALSLQQWLIIGASVLVMVAGSVFVATYQGKWTSGQFLIFTGILSAATAFGGFKTRKISVLLSNFLAAFSSAMQLASMSIILDMFNTDFAWNTMPAWAWVVSLTVVGVLAAGLARFSRNFGWKGIAMLAFTATTVMLEIGVIRTVVGPSAVVIHLAIASLFAAGLLGINRVLRAIPHPEAVSPEYEAYEANLAKLADNSLFQFGRIAAALQIIVAVGLILLNVTSLFTQPFAPWSTLALAAVWCVLSLTAKFWSGQLATDGGDASILAKAAPAVIFISLAATAIEATWSLQGGMLWSNIVLSLLGLGALAFLATITRWFKPSINQVTAMLAAGGAGWLLWNSALQLVIANQAALAGFLIGMGLLLNFHDLLFKVKRFEWAGGLLNGLAMLLYLTDVFANHKVASGSLVETLLLLLLIALAHLQLPVRNLAGRISDGTAGVSFDGALINGWIGFGTSAALIIGAVSQARDAHHFAPFASSMLIYPVAALALSIWGPLKSWAALLNAHAYLGHVVPIAFVVVSVGQFGIFGGSASALELAALAVINYGFGAAKKQALRMQIGFGAAFVAFWLLMPNLNTPNLALVATVQVIGVAVLALLHAWAMARRSSLTMAGTSVASIVAIPLGLVVGFVANGDAWALHIGGASDYLLAMFSILALGSMVLARQFAARLFTGSAQVFTMMIFSYASFSLVLANAYNGADFTTSIVRRLVAALVLVVVIRLRTKAFSGQTELAFFYLANLWLAFEVGLLTEHLAPNFYGPERLTVWFAAAVAISTVLSGRDLGSRRSVLMLDVPVLGTAAVSLLTAFTNLTSPEQMVRGSISLLVICAFSYWRSAKGNTGWLALGYLAGIGTALWVALGAVLGLHIHNLVPETYELAMGLAVLVGNRFMKRRLEKDTTDARVGLLAAALTLPSLSSALVAGLTPAENAWRAIGAFLILTAVAVWRTTRTGKQLWIAGAYVFAIGEAWAIGTLVTQTVAADFRGPELFAILLTAGVVGVNRVVHRSVKPLGNLITWDLPVAIATLPSLVYGLMQNQSDASSQWRIVLVLLVGTGLAYLRTSQSGLIGWIVAAYLGAGAEAIALGHLVSLHWLTNFAGPEIYSVLAGLSVLATHRVALRKLHLKTTLFSRGLPIAVLLIPSIIYTYSSLALPFQQLDGLQIARMLVGLLASIVLLVLGIRLGNLANATMGLVGLTLVVLPNIAAHSTNTTRGSQVETTSLTLGALVFIGLWIFGKYGSLKGNSRLFIGLPVVIILAPALVRSFIALASPELTTIDWWRFSIILAASMTLLVIGSLRELAGMFYPGLASLLLSALPYGFKQSQSQSTGWLLWVMLLLVASVMVWLAVRLERLKKQGRTSAAWLKELR